MFRFEAERRTIYNFTYLYYLAQFDNEMIRKLIKIKILLTHCLNLWFFLLMSFLILILGISNKESNN